MRDGGADRLLARLGRGQEAALHRVPGRIEVLGKHTDYAGGRSLLCAVNRGFLLASAPRDDRTVRIEDAQSGHVVEIVTTRPSGRRTPVWRVYPEAVVGRARRDFATDLRGCHIVFESDLPSAAGLSSSTALLTGVFLALDAANGLLDSERGRAVIGSREELADYLASVESGRPFRPFTSLPAAGPPQDSAARTSGAGTRGGSQDHTAILCSVPNALVQYAFRPARREGVIALPEELTFAVGSSGVRASKAGRTRARFNRLSDLAAEIAELWRRETGSAGDHPGAILRSAPDATSRLTRVVERAADSSSALLDRLHHFLAESEEIVPAAARALEAGDLGTLGALVDRSQELAGRLLENQVPETVALARMARDAGALAASSFGAGFGGAVWALVESRSSEEFLADWRLDYHQRFPARSGDSAFFLTRAEAPAGPLPARLQ